MTEEALSPRRWPVWPRLLFPSRRQWVHRLFESAGVRIGGSHPWDPHVLRDRFYVRLLAQGSLGLGEAYMDGDWDCAALDQFFERVINARLSDKIGLTLPLAMLIGGAKLSNRQSIRRARRVAQVHYDLPVEVFEATFDKRLTGSCAYWPEAGTLDDAQEAKLDLVCRKIGLQPGQTVLDIGSGWGSFVGFAAERYGAATSGITISPVQAAYAARRYAGQSVAIQVADYRDYRGPRADHVISIGMFEHVGSRNYRAYFECVRRHLKDDGFFLLHTIVENERYPAIDPWQDKYIFPNGDLPSVGEIATAVEGLFVIEDFHNFGPDYDRTLMAWNENFQSRRKHIAGLQGERFCRMWEYYLLQNAAAFRSRHISVGQFVLSPRGVRGGYRAVR